MTHHSAPAATIESLVRCARCGELFAPSVQLRRQCPACLLSHALPSDRGSSASSPARFKPPLVGDLAPLFAQLEIVELIGAGGMSAVYRARQSSLGRTVALKILPLEIAAIAGGHERFQREARTLARLNHPGIVQIYDAGEAGPWRYIVMEYVAGASLREVMGESPLPPAEVLRIAAAICDGLQYAHDAQVVHRDIKPENVLLGASGEVKLADFGLAKPARLANCAERVSRTGQIVGTPHYVAPEQVETPGDVDRRADVYSLGVMLYEMLTGELPKGRFDPPSSRAGSDPALDAIVMQSLSRDRRDRPQHASELRAQLAAAQHEPAVAIKEPGSNPTKAVSATGINDVRKMAWEALLSACSLMGAAIGFVGGLNALDGYRGWLDPRPVEQDGVYFAQAQPLFGLAGMTLVALVACLMSFAFARISVASRRCYSELSWAQLPCVLPLAIAYLSLLILLLFWPAFLVWLLAFLPMVMKAETWGLFGLAFTQIDGESLFTGSWLRIHGVSLSLAAVWCAIVAVSIEKNAALLRGAFHPTGHLEAADALKRCALLAAIVATPLAIGLLLASFF